MTTLQQIQIIERITGWSWVPTYEVPEKGAFFFGDSVFPHQWPSWETLIKIEEAVGLTKRENVALRVKWINGMRSIVALRCPKNKMGAALVTDVDLMFATFEERLQALVKAIDKV